MKRPSAWAAWQDQKLAQRLRDKMLGFRRENHLTLRQFAELCGLNFRTISLYELSERRPSVPSIVMIAKGLGMRPSELLHELLGDLDDPPPIAEEASGNAL